MALTGIVFYHPKNPQNLSDVASIAASLRVPLYVVRRPGAQYSFQAPPRARIIYVDDPSEVRGLPEGTVFLVLETYALRYMNEVEIPEKVALVVGAEDYGIPEKEAAKLPGKVVTAKIPVAVMGMSYNVVVTVSMAVYEIKRRLALRGGSPGTGEAR